MKSFKRSFCRVNTCSGFRLLFILIAAPGNSAYLSSTLRSHPPFRPPLKLLRSQELCEETPPLGALRGGRQGIGAAEQLLGHALGARGQRSSG